MGVGGARITPVLLTRLINDVGDNSDQLSILQHALNRTWAHWESTSATGPLDLPDYEAIGTMSNALDQHAEEAFAAVGGQAYQGPEAVTCEHRPLRRSRRPADYGPRAFTCQHRPLRPSRRPDDCGAGAFACQLRPTNLRANLQSPHRQQIAPLGGIRRPTRLHTLCELTESPEAEVKSVIDIFRDPSRSFLMPPLGEPLTPDSVIDISHESLMRIWTRCKMWVDEEAESAAQYRRLNQNAELYASRAAGLLTDPELSLMLNWTERSKPNAAWAERYGGPFERSRFFLQQSRVARDAQILAEEELRKRELRRARAVSIVVGCACLLVSPGVWSDGLYRPPA